MNAPRLAALAAIPTALLLASCGGGSSGIAAPPGQHANIRFLNGAPDIGPVDFYYQATGAAAPTSPASTTTANIAYAVTTPFVQEAPTAATIVVRLAGSSSSSPAFDGLSCPIPQLANNGNYTVVISGVANGARQCLIFQDLNYNQPNTAQYRMHNAAVGYAAATASNTLAYATAPTNTPPGTAVPYVGAQVAPLGANALGITPAYTQVSPAGPIGNAASNPAFVVGPNTGGATFPVVASLNASSLFASGATTQPNTTGALNFPATAGTSIFAIDCTNTSVTGLTNISCNNGLALIGTFDTL